MHPHCRDAANWTTLGFHFFVLFVFIIVYIMSYHVEISFLRIKKVELELDVGRSLNEM